MPNQQNPYEAGISSVLLEKGFLQHDTPIVAGVGGQTIFSTEKEIGNDFVLFENGVVSARDINKTGDKELTSLTSIPEGTVVNITY